MNGKMMILLTVEWSMIFFIIFLWADYEDKFPMKILTIFLLSILIFYIWNKNFANLLNSIF